MRRAVEAVNDRDPDRMIKLIAEGFWSAVTPVPSIEPRPYRGADGVRQFFADARASEHIEARVDEIRDLDNRLLVLGELQPGTRGAEHSTSRPARLGDRFAGGKIKRIRHTAIRTTHRRPPASAYAPLTPPARDSPRSTAHICGALPAGDSRHQLFVGPLAVRT